MTSVGEPYLVLPGSNVFSDFRLARLAQGIGATEVRGLWVHYVNPLRNLNEDEISILKQLLSYGEDPSTIDQLTSTLLDALNHNGDLRDPNVAIFYVFPRPGTISPWSSQATSIAHVCTLEGAIKQIERGMAIAATFDTPLDANTIPEPDILHDPMTQKISRTPPDLNAIFGEHEPTLAAK